MTIRRSLLTLTLLFTSTVAFAEGKPSQQPDALAVDQACAEDAKTAGCGTEQVGTGLMKCIRAYKKAHADWKPSEGCHAAMKKAHADHKGKHKGGEKPPAPPAP